MKSCRSCDSHEPKGKVRFVIQSIMVPCTLQHGRPLFLFLVILSFFLLFLVSSPCLSQQLAKEMVTEVSDHGSEAENEENSVYERQKTLEEYFAPAPPHGVSYVISSDSGSASEENSDWLISDHDDSAAEQDLEVWLITCTCT